MGKKSQRSGGPQPRPMSEQPSQDPRIQRVVSTTATTQVTQLQLSADITRSLVTGVKKLGNVK